MVVEEVMTVKPGLQELCGMVYTGEIILPIDIEPSSPFLLKFIQRINESDLRQPVVGRQANLFSWITSDDYTGTQRTEAEKFLHECLMNSKKKL